MKLTEQETAELFRAMTARRERGEDGLDRDLTDCLDEELLVRAGANELSAQERERVAAHIAGCSDCAREYRVARSMRPFGAAARAELGSRFPIWQSVAAAAAVACIVLTLLWRNDGGDLRRELAVQQQELTRMRAALAAARVRPLPALHPMAAPVTPQLGVTIVDLDADGSRGATAAPSIIARPKGTGDIVLILHLPAEIRAPAQIEMSGANGAMWQDTLSSGIEGGTVTLSLPRALAPPGNYTVRVRSGKSEATFPFRVTDR